MHNPKVAIALCVKNAEATIKDAIVSIINEDYPHDLMTLLIIDGHSTDKTLPIIEKHLSTSDVRFSVFYENKGLGQARQIAIDNADGDYIIWVDGDMVLSRSYVSKLVEFMEQNPKVGLASGQFGPRNNETLVADLQDIDWIIGDYLKRQIPNADPRRVCCAGSICRVDAIKKAGGFNVEIKGAGEDVDFGYRIMNAGWTLHFGVNAVMQHKAKSTWKSLWNESFWYGYGAHYISHNQTVTFSSSSSLSDGLKRFLLAIRLIRRRNVLLLPLLQVFKNIAWLFGFTKAHLDEYGH